MSDIDLVYKKSKQPAQPTTPKEKEEGDYTKVMEKVDTDVPPTPDSPVEAASGGSEAVKSVRRGKAYGRTGELLDMIPPMPDKRRPERYAFQFWSDQITRLKKLKQVIDVENVEEREEISLSDMVREAIDDYIAKRVSKLKRNERTDK